jgi:REP element-mobilizing transposase RayT
MTTLMARVRNHSVSTMVVHAVWATAGRASVLLPSADEWIAQVLRRKAMELGAVMLAVGHAADHVHVVLQHAPAMAVATLVGRLKGASSRAAHVSGVMGGDEGWQVGYWAESVGAAHLEPLLDYVTHPRVHHATASALEPWQQPLPEPAAGGLRAPMS